MVARIEGFLDGNTYQSQMARRLLASSRLFGTGMQSIEHLPNAMNDFVLVSAIAKQGIIFGASIVLTSALLIFLLYKAAFKSRDLYGFFLALTCCNILAIRIILSVFVNFNMVPIVSVNLPFVSYGYGMPLIVDAILIGAVLSVARHSLVLKSPKTRTFIPRIKNVFQVCAQPLADLVFPGKDESHVEEICPHCGKTISMKISGTSGNLGNGSRRLADS
jgi:rod shape determining protein RodA